MAMLDRKLARDVWHLKSQAVAIMLVMACGIATFLMSLTMIESLEYAHESFYERYRFAQVFAQVKRAPDSLLMRVREIAGVAQANARVVHDVNLDVPGLAEPAVGRLISIDDDVGTGLNQLYLRKGRYIVPSRRHEVLAGEAFVDAHGLNPGDEVTAIINGRKQSLRIVGVVLSPEYVYQIRPGELLPDEKRFGVFWMNRRELEAAFNMEGAFNDLAVTLQPDASVDFVMKRIDDLTERYGGLGAFDRNDHPSHRFVANEIKELRSMAVVAPSIFLAVAAFLLHIVLARIIATQREQIGALKAFGYTKFEIGLHYLKLGLLIVSFGLLLGVGVGAWLGRGLTKMYATFFHFPEFTYRLEPWVLALAAGVAFASALVGTWSAVRRAVRLPPAEAMRPEKPATYQATFLERLGVQRVLSPTARMVLRHLERRPVRSLVSSFGIALATAVLVLGSYMEDAIDYIMDLEYGVAQRQDMTVTFNEALSSRAAYELRHAPGVRNVEPFRAVPARLRSAHRNRLVSVIGLPADQNLFRTIDLKGRIVQLPERGLVISSKLAELLHVVPGEFITLEVLSETRPTVQVMLAGTIDDFAGLSAYMHIDHLHGIMREAGSYSGAYLSVDSPRLDDLYHELKETPAVASVTITKAALQSFQDTIAENLLRMRMFNIAFAAIIAFGVVYNSARISLSERSRDLATLRVMGFTRAEVSFILLGEIVVLTAIALPLGLWLGYLFAAWASVAYDTELFRMPLIISRSTYAFAAVVVVIATIVSCYIARRRIDHLDLVGVLKTRE